MYMYASCYQQRSPNTCTLYFILFWWILISTPHVNYVWVITSWSYCPLNFAFVCQYGQRANDKAAATPLVEHAPAPGKGKKGKKDAKKDKLDDLKQELEMVHNINRLHVNLYNISSKKIICVCHDLVFATMSTPLCMHFVQCDYS